MNESKVFLALAAALLLLACCSAGCISQDSSDDIENDAHDPVYAMWYFIDSNDTRIELFMDDTDHTGDLCTGDNNSAFYDKIYKFTWGFDKTAGKFRYYSLVFDNTISATVKYNEDTDTIEFYLKDKPSEVITLRRIT